LRLQNWNNIRHVSVG